MKRIFNLFLVLAFTTVMSLSAMPHTADNPYVTPLIAGGGSFESAIVVGQVEVWNDENNLYVRYLIGESDWCMTATHLHIATDPNDIPQKNGNPPPGQFEYQMPHECIKEYTYEIEIKWPVGTELYVAAHADVCTQTGLSSHIDAFAEILPETVAMNLYRPGPLSYFLITITNGGALDGVYNGWCVDTDRNISTGGGSILYNAYVYSSYEELPSDAIDFPENLDLVNWILNQNFVGQISISGGAFAPGDIQIAIWSLIEDEHDCCVGGVGPWSQARVDEIVSAAEANGEGFIPGCFDIIGVILIPFSGDLSPSAQVVLIPLVLPCIPVQCETAWGDGFDFPGKNWALYFTYGIQ